MLDFWTINDMILFGKKALCWELCAFWPSILLKQWWFQCFHCIVLHLPAKDVAKEHLNAYTWHMCLVGFKTTGAKKTDANVDRSRLRPGRVRGHCPIHGKAVHCAPWTFECWSISGFLVPSKCVGADNRGPIYIHFFSRWWFQIFSIFTPTWGNGPIWLIFFNWVETTN